MMFDYLMAWANDKDLKSLGVVAFIGADDKAFCSDQSIILSSSEKGKDCNRGNDGVRQAGGDGEKKEEEKNKESFEDDGGPGEENCFSWKGGLIWTTSTKCTDWEQWNKKVQVGQMYGLSKGASGFKKLKESPN